MPDPLQVRPGAVMITVPGHVLLYPNLQHTIRPSCGFQMCFPFDPHFELLFGQYLLCR